MSLTQLLFIFAFLAATWLALFRHPVYGAMLYVSLLFVNPQQRWWGTGILEPFRWALLASIITAVALLIHSSSRKAEPRKSIWKQYPFLLVVALTLWMALQSAWALDSAEHASLLNFYIKFIAAMVLLYYSLDSEKAVLLLCRAYVAGGAYFGWIAYSEHEGGRFEGFGGAGLGEANAGALAIVTSIFVGASLFLRGSRRERLILLAVFPFLLNGLVTTVSRSGFLALTAGGIAYLIFTVPQYKRTVKVLALPAVILFLMLAGPSYWQRMQTLKHAGEQVEGVDTGIGRIEIMKAQLRMARAYPMGCGATCTATLSPLYMPDEMLTESRGGGRARASHNTFLSFLVEHGLFGAMLYIAIALWTLKSMISLRKVYAESNSILAVVVPALAGVATANYVADQFVTYVKFEPRMWFLVLIMVTLGLAERHGKIRNVPVNKLHV
jgi:O-Antigen ligase